MSKASELMARVLERMDERNLHAYYLNGVHKKDGTESNGVQDKNIDVRETYRSNGTAENVTVTIECMVRISEYASRTVLTVRVPKGASDRVIDRRLDEVERFMLD